MRLVHMILFFPVAVFSPLAVADSCVQDFKYFCTCANRPGYVDTFDINYTRLTLSTGEISTIKVLDSATAYDSTAADKCQRKLVTNDICRALGLR